MKEFNIISQKATQRDRDLLFGPFNGNDIWIDLDEGWDMSDIWVMVGLFKSKTQARKNNHSGLAPMGFTDIIKKKRNLRVTIWNTKGL